MAQRLTWLITGTSPGSFGEYLALAVLARGDNVIATARRTSKLAGLEKAGAQTLQLDVAGRQDVLDQKAAQALELAGGFVDVLVNNAGTTFMSTIEEIKQADLLREFQINTFGPITLTRAFLPSYRAAKKPAAVVFITSAAGINGSPGSGTYTASKHALEGFVGLAQPGDALDAESALSGHRMRIHSNQLYRQYRLALDGDC